MSESIKVLDHGYVKFIESWGSDERIIEAARQSTSGSFRGWDSDQRLLQYLWKNGHHTPFEMCGITVEVQAPLFVLREWHRHRTQSYNELSARYTELPDLYYIPSAERLAGAKQSSKNKQGSEEGFSALDAAVIRFDIIEATSASRRAYDNLISKGVAREVARLVIPVNQYSRMRASANLRNWLHFLTLRTAENAQLEIREYANVVASIVEEKFPRTYALWSAK